MVVDEKLCSQADSVLLRYETTYIQPLAYVDTPR